MQIKLTGRRGTVEPMARFLQQYFKLESNMHSAGGGEGFKEKIIVSGHIKDGVILDFTKRLHEK